MEVQEDITNAEIADGNDIIGWTAVLDDDTAIEMVDAKTFDNVPVERCKAVSVKVRGQPRDVHVSCVLDRGERIHVFTRRAVKLGANATNGGTLNMPVLEVKAVDGTFARLYVHPRHGCIFSTLDLNL